jgi:hypothetical protein
LQTMNAGVMNPQSVAGNKSDAGGARKLAE